MALQTVLSAVSANTVSSAVDVTDDFTVSTVGLRSGECVVIEIADTDTNARYNKCGPLGVISDQTAYTFSVKGAWKLRARPVGLTSSSSLTVLVNQ